MGEGGPEPIPGRCQFWRVWGVLLELYGTRCHRDAELCTEMHKVCTYIPWYYEIKDVHYLTIIVQSVHKCVESVGRGRFWGKRGFLGLFGGIWGHFGSFCAIGVK